VPALYDQRMSCYPPPPPPYARNSSYQPASMYYYPPQYSGGKPTYGQDPVMVVHQGAEPVYLRPPPAEAAYQRVRSIQQPPAPPPSPAKATEKKSRLAQPPPRPPAPPVKQAPPPPPPAIAPKPKVEERQVILPQKPGFTPDFLKAPGCFDIVARGALPAISFFSDVSL
jgi:hypothetical protein